MNTRQQELQNKILKYIDHAAMLADHSRNVSAYHTHERMSGAYFASELKKMLKRECPMTEVCKFTLMIKRSLRAILPLYGNSSFASSEQKLIEIINTCKQWLNPTHTPLTPLERGIMEPGLTQEQGLRPSAQL